MSKGAKPVLHVGIGGGSASGKSTLVDHLAEQLSDIGVSVVCLDSFYKELDQTFDPDKHNLDAPQSIDFPLLQKTLELLLSGNAADVPIYDFANHRRGASAIVKPAPIMITEGILALHDPSIVQLYDVTIFVDADPDVRYQRRLRRDVEERGRSEESVRAQWHASVLPMHAKFCEPTQRFVDYALRRDADRTAIVTRLRTLFERASQSRQG